MTVAIGLVCSDGVIVASDSMGSNQMIAERAVKVYALENFPVVWTASGSVYVIEEVGQALDELDASAKTNTGLQKTFHTPNLVPLRRILQRSILPKMKACYDNALPHGPKQADPSGTKHAFQTDFLVLGYTNGKAWFLEFAADGQMNWHTGNRFYALGSGGPFASVANALMQHYTEGDPLPVELGVRLAFRAIETTCDVSSMWVGPPVQIAVADASGGRVYSEADVEAVKDAVSGWKTIERDALRGRVRSVDDTAEELPEMDREGG